MSAQACWHAVKVATAGYRIMTRREMELRVESGDPFRCDDPPCGVPATSFPDIMILPTTKGHSMALHAYDVYDGVPVQVKGLGPGYVVKVTRGARPYHVQTLAGGRYVCALSHLEEIVSDETRIKAKEAYRASLLEEIDASRELTLGSLVTLDKREATYVVIGVVKSGKVKVAQLGGDDNRYVTAPVGMVHKINAGTVRAFVDSSK